MISKTINSHMKCLNCNFVLTGKYQKKFCSKKCASILNNKKFPKRSKEKTLWGKCKICENSLDRKGLKFCRSCIKNKKHYHGIPIENHTIESVSKVSGSNKYSRIRDHARNVYKKLNGISCENCNYSKHIEICHKKAISSFPKDTIISEVNDRKNIIFLCPNCHWEFDHGLLNIEKIGQDGLEPSTYPL